MQSGASVKARTRLRGCSGYVRVERTVCRGNWDQRMRGRGGVRIRPEEEKESDHKEAHHAIGMLSRALATLEDPLRAALVGC